MTKKFRCKIGFHSYESEKNDLKVCIFCGVKSDKNSRHHQGWGDGGTGSGMDGGC